MPADTLSYQSNQYFSSHQAYVFQYISTGAVAAVGIISTIGEKNSMSRKHIPVNITVSPVFPPASTPADDSRYVVMLGIPNNAPTLVDTAST